MTRPRRLMGMLAAAWLTVSTPLHADDDTGWMPDPATLPWFPHLTIAEEPELCAHVLDLERQVFLTGEPVSSLSDSGITNWSRPGEEAEDIGLSVLDRRGNPFFDAYLVADIDNDGDVDTLAVSPFSRNFFVLARYLLFDEEVTVATYRNVGDSPWSEVFPSASLLLSQDERFQSPVGPTMSLGAEPYRRTHPVDVLVFGESTYLLVSGRIDDGQDVVAVVSVGPDHTTDLDCLVSTGPGHDVMDQFANLPTLRTLHETIATTKGKGNDEMCGVRHQSTLTKLRQDQLRTTVWVTPWLLEVDRITEEYDESVLQFMLWGNRSLTAWRQLQELVAGVAGATHELAGHYMANFDVPEETALLWANLAVQAQINTAYWFTGSLSSGMAIAPEHLTMNDALDPARLELLMQAYRSYAGEFRPYDQAKLAGLRLNALVLHGDPDGLVPALLDAESSFEAGWEPALVYAVGQPELMGLLMSAGAPVNAPNAFGKTALMYAAQDGDVASARALLKAGAVVSPVTWPQEDCYHLVRFTRTALDYAIQSGSQEIIDLLREHGAMTAAELGAENAVQH